MTTLTAKLESFYVAYTPDADAYFFGGCFEEAVNGLADELRMREDQERTSEEKKIHATG